MPRSRPRPTNSRLSASADPNPSANEITVEKNVQMNVFQVALRNASLVRIRV